MTIGSVMTKEWIAGFINHIGAAFGGSGRIWAFQV